MKLFLFHICTTFGRFRLDVEELTQHSTGMNSELKSVPIDAQYSFNVVLLYPWTLNIASIWYMPLHMNFNQTIRMHCKDF
jgi:hypothetical protein